jgi:ribosomal protein S18 acetylase RimI-like enzyme
MSIEIRTFQPNDKKAVIQLWHDCGLVVSEYDPAKDIERKRGEHMNLFLVATQNNQIIGAVMGGYDGHRGAINYLAVSPQHQRQGIGQILIKAVEDKLIALGCAKINLYVRVTNLVVKAFYEKLGYSENRHAISLGKKLVDDGFKPE